MSGFSAAWMRESRRALLGPRAWMLGASMSILAGVPLFATSGSVAAEADFAPSLSIGAWCVLVAFALLGAASVSRERRHGTWDLVLAAPGRPSSVIWGKALSLALASAVVAVAVPLQGLVESMRVGVDGAVILSGFLGTLLVGMVGGAAGLLAGSMIPSGVAATALALLMLGAWTMLARTLQVMGDPWWASAGFALDPIRRAQGFAQGSIDVGSALAMLCVWVGCVWTAARWCDAQREPRQGTLWRRRIAALALGLPCAIVAALALRGPGVEPPSIDLHGMVPSRASESLQTAMRSLHGPVRLTLLRAGGLGESALGAARSAMRRAAGCEGAQVAIDDIDMLDPAQAGRAAQAIERIEASERAAAMAWRGAFTDGLAALDRVRTSSDLAEACRQGAARKPQGDLAANNLLSLAAALQRAGIEGRAWMDAFEAAAAASAERPLGDLEGSGRALAGELGVWARLLRQGADALGGPGSTRDIREAARRLGALSDACRAAQDQTDRLSPLRLTEVAAALRAPPVVVVATDAGCAAVPAWRLVEGAALADEAIAATIAAAQGAPRTTAIFVHAGQRSLIDATASGADMALVADALRGARMRVESWNPSQSPRPSAREARQRVWIVVPPLERRSLEPDAPEQALLEATQRLLREGEPILVLAAPSVAAAMGMVDPWAVLLQSRGLEARTGAMVVELATQGETERRLRTTIDSIAPAGHAAGQSVRGRFSWPTPVPIALLGSGSTRASSVACVQGRPSLWIEEDPRVISKGLDQVPADRALKSGDCVPVLAVSEVDGRRCALAGGVAWALSASSGVADARGALQHSGNRDLFVGTVRWLAGEDAPGATGAGPERGWMQRVAAILWLPALLMALFPVVASLARRRA